MTTIPLVRNDLKPLICLTNLKSAHAGLLMQRGLPVWEAGEKGEKTALINRISKISAPSFYQQAFDRWFALTQSDNFAHVVAKVNGRLLTGLPLGGTLETGMMTHHTYGTPLLAGSSIKGAASAYAESIKLEKNIIKALFGAGPDDDSGDGLEGVSGALIWHDAWWIPSNCATKPFVKDVVTVHEQRYYSSQSSDADGTESPIPNLQIGIQGEFYFVLEGEPNWARYAADLLNAMLEEQGMGAKTASGYGYFIDRPEILEDLKKAAQDNKEQVEKKQMIANMSAAERIVYDIKECLKRPGLAPNNAQEEFSLFMEKLEKAKAMTVEDQKLIGTELSYSVVKIIVSKKKEREVKALLRQLVGEEG